MAKFTLPLQSDENFASGRNIRELNRRVDIVVLKPGASDTDTPENLVFVEAKSLQVKQRLNKGSRENGRGWAKSRFRRWNQQDSGRTSYHRQYTLDNIAIYNRSFGGGVTQQFASDYKWWFQSWNRYQKPRTYKVKKGGVKKTETHWAGVPPDAKEIGKPDDRDWHRAADRMAQVMKKLKNSNILKDSLGFKDSAGVSKDFYEKKDFYGISQYYFLNPHGSSFAGDDRFKRVKVFNFLNILIEQPELRARFGMPDDLLAYYEGLKFDADNAAQFIEDVTDGLDEYDIPIDIPVDEWVDSLAQSFANSDFNFFGDNCDF